MTLHIPHCPKCGHRLHTADLLRGEVCRECREER